MSDTTANLRRQLDSAAQLQSVVRTMKAMAAASIGQYEQSVRALAHYYRTVQLGLSACLRASGPLALGNAARRKTAVAVTGAVVFGSDQGLVGRFNEVMADHAAAALAALPGKPQIWAVGERIRARLADRGLPVVSCFAVPTSVDAITPLVDQILLEFEARARRDDLTALYLFHHHPTAAETYVPATQQLLPLDDAWRTALAKLAWPTATVPEVIGGGAATLRALIRDYLFISLFRACAESLASENACRLAAMERADRNIDDLLETLRGTFRRLRQSRIDEELFDVVAGFEAINQNRR
jgi:F-type H+-transporting ATPase subunit gamma